MRLKPGYHEYLYFFGLALMVAGLPLSKFLMSVSQIWLGGNWFWEGNYKEKIKRFWKNKAAVLLCSIFLLHLIGLLYTSNFDYAMRDIRIKLPLLILPFIIASSKQLSFTRFRTLMWLFVAAVTIGTVFSMLALAGVIERDVTDFRKISLFISPIRFGLLICVAIFSLIYYTVKSNPSLRAKVLQMITAGWLLVFLFILSSVTGIVALAAAAIVSTVHYVFRKGNRTLKFISVLIIIIGMGGFARTAYQNAKPFFTAGQMPVRSELDAYSAGGEHYYHNFDYPLIENGNYVWLNVAWKELEKSWGGRSSVDFFGNDRKGNKLKATLTRFLTSKGLRKDAEGMANLTDEEIRAIENGIANVRFMKQINFNTRVYQIIWELHNYSIGGNPEGNSVAQRLEFLKAGLAIFTDNPVIGVGTGDVFDAYFEQYEKMNTKLSRKYWLRAHNQYLTILITFGSIGFIWFMAALLYPFFKAPGAGHFLYIAFFAIAAISMLTDDTLEGQAGVTFFTGFFCLFLFARNNNNTE